MTIPIEELLTVLCPGASSARSADLQKAYLIPDVAGAKMAYEVLTAYGFDAKLYPEADASKLYVALPPAGDAWGKKFSAALAHARSLASIRQNLDGVSSMTFANAIGGGKQLVIQFAPAAAETAKPPTASPRAAPVFLEKKNTGTNPARKAKKGKDSFKALSGPAVGKTSYPDALFAGKREDGLWRQFYLYTRGNIATVTAAFFTFVIVPAIIAFSIFTLTKSFLCRDFALSKMQENHAWYCGTDDGNAPSQN
ncbi:MAG: hypothetical protein KGI29_01530 [Pseudomonadota bacterium]|nr:hypothetical protein [Pseudomonadota bacterium]MDE3037919.1 hypothetical protein [Pseudomonadota bacterium]